MDVSTIVGFFQATLGQTGAEQTATGISGEDLKVIVACVSAAFVMACGALGPGVAEGYTAAKACEGIARNPESAGVVTRAMIIGQAVTESVAIYSLIIAALILFVMV